MQFESSENRVFGLDIFRAVAIIFVLLAHGEFLLDRSIADGFPFFRLIDGVDLFFVLSGFLIGNILLKEINRPEGFILSRLFRFWKRRWFRTLPNYYLILLINYLIVKYGIINEDINKFNYTFLFFLQNFKTPFYGFFWESWSLSIEEWFYIITPVLIFLFSKIFSNKVTFLLSTLIMIIFPVLYRIYIYNNSISYFTWDVLFRKTVLCRLDSIGYGLFAAWTFHYYKNMWKKVRLPSFLLGIIMIVIILHIDASHKSVFKQVFYFSTLSFSIMFLLPLSESIKRSRGIFAYIIEHISKISYSMYLVNLALVAEVLRDHFIPVNSADAIFKYIIYWIVVIVVSSLLYKYYEKPVMNLRDKKLLPGKITRYWSTRR